MTRGTSDFQKIFDGDINLRSYGLKVDETADKIVVSGVVDTLSEKQHAEKILREAVRDKQVEMAVSISTDGAIDDQDVAMEVAEEISTDPELADRVKVRVEKGVAHLSGNIPHQELKKKALRKAASARGVTKVTSQLRIGDDEDMDNLDDIFHSQVRNDREEEEDRE